MAENCALQLHRCLFAFLQESQCLSVFLCKKARVYRVFLRFWKKVHGFCVFYVCVYMVSVRLRHAILRVLTVSFLWQSISLCPKPFSIGVYIVSSYHRAVTFRLVRLVR